MAQDVPHWRLQEQVPESPAPPPAPLSPHQEPQQPGPSAPRPTASVARPDTPPRPDAPRISSPSPTAVAPPATGVSTSAGAVEALTSDSHRNSHAPSPTTAKDDHQHLLAPSTTSTSTPIATATSTSAVPNSHLHAGASSVSTNIAQGANTNGTVRDSAPTGGVNTAAQGGSFHSSTAGASTSSEQPSTVTRVPGSSTPTTDGPPPTLNGQQPQQPQRPPQAHVPAPSPTSIPDATNSAATSTSTSTSVNATLSSATDSATTTIPSTAPTSSIRSNFRDPIRWRDPITVQYDTDSGHAHPARIHAHPAHHPSSSSSQLPPPAQLKYEPSRQYQEPPRSQPPSHSQLPAQAQPQSSAHESTVQARSIRAHHYNQPSYQFHPQPYRSQPPLQPDRASVPSTQLPPPARSQRDSYQHHPQASQYQHQAPPPARSQQHYQHSYLLGDPRHHPPPPPSQQQNHPQESQYTSRNDGLITKPIIMDPPRSRPVSQPPPAADPLPGFPSPVTTHAHLNKKFADDCTRLTYAIQQSTPDAVRRVFRDNWEKCMLGTEFHQAFIVSPPALPFQVNMRRPIRSGATSPAPHLHHTYTTARLSPYICLRETSNVIPTSGALDLLQANVYRHVGVLVSLVNTSIIDERWVEILKQRSILLSSLFAIICLSSHLM